MLADHFPLLGLSLTTPRLRLCLPDAEQLSALADAAADGVHEPGTMPFRVPWTDVPPGDRARSVVLHYWATLGRWTPRAWSLPLTVVWEGQVVGQQSITGQEFAVTRECTSGSWLGLRFQGRGIGTEMRAAIAHLAFAGLGAETVASSVFLENPSSLGVSRKLGYRDDGVNRYEVQGKLRVAQRVRLSREDWAEHQRVPVVVDGLDPCRELFGLPPAVPLR